MIGQAMQRFARCGLGFLLCWTQSRIACAEAVPVLVTADGVVHGVRIGSSLPQVIDALKGCETRLGADTSEGMPYAVFRVTCSDKLTFSVEWSEPQNAVYRMVLEGGPGATVAGIRIGMRFAEIDSRLGPPEVYKGEGTVSFVYPKLPGFSFVLSSEEAAPYFTFPAPAGESAIKGRVAQILVTRSVP